MQIIFTDGNLNLFVFMYSLSCYASHDRGVRREIAKVRPKPACNYATTA